MPLGLPKLFFSSTNCIVVIAPLALPRRRRPLPVRGPRARVDRRPRAAGRPPGPAPGPAPGPTPGPAPRPAPGPPSSSWAFLPPPLLRLRGRGRLAAHGDVDTSNVIPACRGGVFGAGARLSVVVAFDAHQRRSRLVRLAHPVGASAPMRASRIAERIRIDEEFQGWDLGSSDLRKRDRPFGFHLFANPDTATPNNDVTEPLNLRRLLLLPRLARYLMVK